MDHEDSNVIPVKDIEEYIAELIEDRDRNPKGSLIWRWYNDLIGAVREILERHGIE